MGVLINVAFLLLGAAFAAFFFACGWRLRDAAATAQGEPSLLVGSGRKNVVLEAWDLPEEVN